MPTGQAMIDLAKRHIGELYESVVVPKNDPNWHGPWDCAELLSWLVYQVSQQLYGCVNDEAPPATADAYTGGWESDSANLGRRVSIQQAAATAGGILLRYPPTAGAEGHAVICDGVGGTVEAKNSVSGVVADTVQDRYWDTGCADSQYHLRSRQHIARLSSPASALRDRRAEHDRQHGHGDPKGFGRRGFRPWTDRRASSVRGRPGRPLITNAPTGSSRMGRSGSKRLRLSMSS